jgi:hypothetical protein
MARRMSAELRIDLEMLWEEMVVDKEFNTDRSLISLGEILGYRCDNRGREIKVESDEQF